MSSDASTGPAGPRTEPVAGGDAAPGLPHRASAPAPAAALAAFSRRAMAGEDVSELIAAAATAAVEAVGADCSAVYELVSAGGGAVLRAGVGAQAELHASLTGGEAVVEGRVFRSALSARVLPGGRMWGTLSVFARRHAAFDEEDALLLESIADVLAMAIDGAAVAVALRRSERRLAAAFDTSLLGTLVVGSDGFLQDVNGAFCDMLGYDDPAQLRGVSFLVITPAADAVVNMLQFRGMFDLSANRIRTVKRFLHRDGHIVWIDLTVVSFEAADDGSRNFLVQAQDITERLRAESALRDSEERLRAVLRNAPVVIFTLDPEGALTFVEGRALQALGLRTADLLGRSAFSVYPEHSQVRSVLSRALAGEEFFAVLDIGGVTLEGSFRPLISADGRLEQVIGVATDVSERTRAESDLRRTIDELRAADEERRRLLGHVVTAQEEERRRVANDVHDEALPTLATAILLIGQLGEELSGAQAQTLRGIDEALAGTVEQLRHLIGGLRPPGLDHGRLVPALRQAARSVFSDAIEVVVTGELSMEPRGSPRAVVYRIAQEAFENSRKHAGARHVEVHVTEVDDGVRVTIHDDGSGFDARETTDSPPLGHLGMISMRERAEFVGGWWRVESTPGAGTVIDYWIPLSSDGPRPPERAETPDAR